MTNQSGLSKEGRAKGASATKRPYRWSIHEIAAAAGKSIHQVRKDKQSGLVDLKNLTSVHLYLGQSNPKLHECDYCGRVKPCSQMVMLEPVRKVSCCEKDGCWETFFKSL